MKRIGIITEAVPVAKAELKSIGWLPQKYKGVYIDRMTCGRWCVYGPPAKGYKVYQSLEQILADFKITEEAKGILYQKIEATKELELV